MHQMHFSSTSETVALSAAGLSSRSRLRGTQGGGVYTRRKFGPRPGSVARALGVQRRDLARNHEIEFRLAEPRRTMETPQFKIFVPLLLLLLYQSLSHRPLSSQALYLVAATVQQQSHINLFLS